MVHVNELIFRFMTDQGDGTGDTSYIGDYSTIPKTLYITPGTNVGSGGPIQLHRMLIRVEDGTNMTATEYGRLGSALTTGIKFAVVRDGVVQGVFPDAGIETNADWGALCYDVDIKTWGSPPTDDVLVVRWTFAKAGNPIRLQPGDEFQIILADNFTGLVAQSFHVQGIDEGTKS